MPSEYQEAANRSDDWQAGHRCLSDYQHGLLLGRSGLAIDEEQVRAAVGPPSSGEVRNDTLDVLGSRRKEIDRIDRHGLPRRMQRLNGCDPSACALTDLVSRNGTTE